MIYTAYELLAKLNLLTLVGQYDGELEFVGSDEAWRDLGNEEDFIIGQFALKN